MSLVLSCATILLVLLAGCGCAFAGRPQGFDQTTETVHDDSSSLGNNKNDRMMILTDTQGTSRLQTTTSEIQKPIGSNENMEVREIMKRSQKRSNSTISNMNYQNQVIVSETGAGATKVTYRVRKRKRGEKQPGFNLDYSPPKVHPPHHN